MDAIDQYVEDMDEWDTVFDPTDKPEYSHAQLLRFAELWAERELKEYKLKIKNNGKTKNEDM
jgi:hypothetical protein